MRLTSLVAVGALLLAASPAIAQANAERAPEAAIAVQEAAATGATWITLGTRAGPVASSTRSQPANLLVFGGKRFLVDVGDGTAGQLAKVGLQTAMLDGVFISHLHFDHTAGLAGILGLRFQTNAQAPLRIFGPPGTKDLVEGLLASMLPGATAGYGVADTPFQDPKLGVAVTEIRDGDTIDVHGAAVTARSNTHYSFASNSDLAKRFESLSYRFDLPGRSIVYTGDTGPSAAVEELARGADLLVAEMMDVENVIALVRRNNPRMPAQAAAGMESHLREHHLLPKDVGELASRAGVKAVVITHFAGSEPEDPAHFEYLRAISANYRGPVVVANDLEAF